MDAVRSTMPRSRRSPTQIPMSRPPTTRMARLASRNRRAGEGLGVRSRPAMRADGSPAGADWGSAEPGSRRVQRRAPQARWSRTRPVTDRWYASPSAPATRTRGRRSSDQGPDHFPSPGRSALEGPDPDAVERRHRPRAGRVDTQDQEVRTMTITTGIRRRLLLGASHLGAHPWRPRGARCHARQARRQQRGHPHRFMHRRRATGSSRSSRTTAPSRSSSRSTRTRTARPGMSGSSRMARPSGPEPAPPTHPVARSR